MFCQYFIGIIARIPNTFTACFKGHQKNFNILTVKQSVLLFFIHTTPMQNSMHRDFIAKHDSVFMLCQYFIAIIASIPNMLTTCFKGHRKIFKILTVMQRVSFFWTYATPLQNSMPQDFITKHEWFMFREYFIKP